METTIQSLGDSGRVPPPRRDRPARDDRDGSFKRELDELVDEDGTALRNEIVVPHPRAADRPISPPTEDEVGLRVDVEA
jgi:hypothetical protein